MTSTVALFRPPDTLPAPVSPPTLPAPVANMTHGVVPYDPSAVRQTRSQARPYNTSYLAARDLVSRSETIPLGDAEAILSRQARKHQPECSLLLYLREPGNGLTAALAATSLLEELADGVEDVSTSTAMFVRYVQAHCMWEDHPNPAVESLEALLGTLDGFQYVQAAAVVGTSSQFMRARTVVLIEQHWGSAWFGQISAEIKDPSWTKPCDCSHQLLRLIAANAKQGLALGEACSGWAESISRRRDERIRREMHMRCSRSPFVIPEDVQLKVELVPRSSKRDYSKLGPPARKKRKRRSGGKEDDRRGDSNAGLLMQKRMKTRAVVGGHRKMASGC